MNIQATDEADLNLIKIWFNNIQKNNKISISINWSEARTAGDYTIAPLFEPRDLFEHNIQQGYRYLITSKTGNNYNGHIIELIMPTKSLSQDQARDIVIRGMQSTFEKGSHLPLDRFTGGIFIYSPRYRFQKGLLYQNGALESKPVRLFSKIINKTHINQPANPSKLSIIQTEPANELVAIEVCETISVVVTSDGNIIGGYNTRSCTTIYTENPASIPAGSTSGWGGISEGSPNSNNSTVPLAEELLHNKIALLNRCPEAIVDWKPLFQFIPPNNVLNRLVTLTNQDKINLEFYSKNPPYWVPTNWSLQALADADGYAINLDYFAVKMTKLPSGFNSPEQLLEYIRLNINSLVNDNLASFTPHPALTGEENLWRNNPLGSILAIGIPLNKGSVIVSEHSPNHWTFSTIHDPWYNDHPVSGNRMFGFTVEPDGYTFYTRGADRVYGQADDLIGYLLTMGTNTPFQFFTSDALWKSFQNKLVMLAGVNPNNNTPYAKIITPVTLRPSFKNIVTALQNGQPLSTIPCN